MLDNTPARLAFKAGRIKIFFASWKPVTMIGATASRVEKYRFIRVGFDDQVPRRLSVLTEYFNADVFFATGPLNQHILNAYQARDEALMERLIMIQLFCQGPAFWQASELKPAVIEGRGLEIATIFSNQGNLLFWSGFDTQLWCEISIKVQEIETLDIGLLGNLISSHMQSVKV